MLRALSGNPSLLKSVLASQQNLITSEAGAPNAAGHTSMRVALAEVKQARVNGGWTECIIFLLLLRRIAHVADVAPCQWI